MAQAPVAPTTTSNDPPMRQPVNPDQPLLARPPVPAFQLSRPGSQFGFCPPTATANTGYGNEANQAPVQAQDSTPTGIRKLSESISMLNYSMTVTLICTHTRPSEIKPGPGTTKPSTLSGILAVGNLQSFSSHCQS